VLTIRLVTGRAMMETSFGDLLRQYRLAARLTQEELAERSGLSARGLSDLERGVRGLPRKDTLQLLLQALDLSPSDCAALATAAKRPARATPQRVRADGQSMLPVPLTPLIGRATDVAAVASFLHDPVVRLLTLVGPGGTGKTRLALAVAERVGPDFADGVVFVDLAPVRDPTHVPTAVATALGLRETPGRRLPQVVCSALADRRLLLVLDNLEQVLAAAPFIAQLLAACADLRVLATSREPLRIAGEQRFPVPPLALPHVDAPPERIGEAAAVQLFVARAQAIDPTLALTHETAADVAAICRRLDGLPLAIELAAARVAVLPVPALRARLDRALPLLTSAGRDAPARQRTLRDAIAWSHDLLEPWEQRLFRRLGVFVGGWTLDAAEAVANSDGDLDVLAGITSLTEKNLVHLESRGAEPRYGMLETIREFAQEQHAKNCDDTLLQQAHAAYFLALAEQAKPHLYTAGQRTWLRRLEAEHPNFRAALAALEASHDGDAHLRLAASLAHFWLFRAHLAEGRSYLERALARTQAPTVSRAEALLGIGSLAFGEGDYQAAETWLRAGEDLARMLNDRGVLWQALAWRGRTAEYEGDDNRAVPLYEAALAVARDLNDAQAIGECLGDLSDAAYRRGDLEAAEQLGEDALVAVRAVGHELMVSMGLCNSGQLALARGDIPRAIAAYQEALDLALGVDIPWIIANALAGSAAVAATQGDHTGAARLLGATDALREASHQPRIAHHYHLAQTTRSVHEALDGAAFAAVWEAGRALPVEEAVATARAVFAHCVRGA
jgi:predicted ATPase/transcriptional regulator with XRE-family HTH domain